MTMLAVPNISEGRDPDLIEELRRTSEAGAARVLDVHSDPVHNRSVFTITGPPDDLLEGCVALTALSVDRIDLTRHGGVHPRLGVVDVCPFVPHNDTLTAAASLARATGRAIARNLGVPVYLYGHAAARQTTKDLPDLRRGGLLGLQERARGGLPPDFGPRSFDPRRGVVCVGARGPLIAFNVSISSDVKVARQIAASIRSASVRALGLQISEQECQVSMNLIDPAVTGIEAAFALVTRATEELNVPIVKTEIVGLVEERFLPSPDATVTRLLKQPGHSLEALLGERP